MSTVSLVCHTVETVRIDLKSKNPLLIKLWEASFLHIGPLSGSRVLLCWKGPSQNRTLRVILLSNKTHCCIFWPTFGCYPLQMLVKICIFNICFSLKAEKGRKSNKIEAKFSKKIVFLSLHPKASQGFYSQKKTFNR